MRVSCVWTSCGEQVVCGEDVCVKGLCVKELCV